MLSWHTKDGGQGYNTSTRLVLSVSILLICSRCRTFRQRQGRDAQAGGGRGADAGWSGQRPSNPSSAAPNPAPDALGSDPGAAEASSHRRFARSQREQLRRVAAETSQCKFALLLWCELILQSSFLPNLSLLCLFCPR